MKSHHPCCPFVFLIAVAVLSVMVPMRSVAHGTNDPAGGASAQWSALGGGLDGSVHSLAISGGELFATGGFDFAGGVPVQGVARWTGSTWLPAGSGLDNRTSFMLMVPFLDGIIVSGNFNQVGGVANTSLARWDGSQWMALPGNAFYSINSLAVYNNELVVSGSSDFTGGRRYIARWNGSTWSALGAGLEGQADALHVHGGRLYAYASRPWPAVGDVIWQWDGNAWTVFEGQINGEIKVFGSHRGDLLAAGRFSAIGGVNARNIARWTGAAWEPLGAGVGSTLPNQRIEVLGSYNGELWAGGYFQTTGSLVTNNLAVWNGSAWYSPGNGVDSTVSALANHGGSLVAGGGFEWVSGAAIPAIASWRVDRILQGSFE